jgi:hypothetical protein
MGTVFANFQGGGIPNFQNLAFASVLTFLASAALLALGTVAFAALLLAGRTGVARRLALAMAGGAALYAAILGAFSLASSNNVLPQGSEKYFCEIDCHIANRVGSVHVTPDVGPLRARGNFWVVTLETRFDPSTISAHRGDAPLRPNPRTLFVLDAAGRRYGESRPAEKDLEAAGQRSTPLDTPLRPGESYATQLVFDLPAGVRRPRLFLGEKDFVTRFLIGHENSFFHGRTTFRLTEAPQRDASASPISSLRAASD